LDTKQEILKVALEIFATKGYENSSVEEIAKKLNITKPAIYYHFKNKKELYNTIFRNYFSNIEFKNYNSLEENIKSYIDTLANLFLNNPNIAKLFSKELSNEAQNLEIDTIIILSKTLKHLTDILKNENVNPFFIQTLIISSFTTYLNTLKLREKIIDIIKNEKLKEFDIKEEIYKTILLHIKAHR